MRARIALIAAVAENGVIGRDNALPWRLSSDLRRFRALTMGKPIIMGRRTFQSIGRLLPGRDMIVVSRSLPSAPEGVTLARSLEEALQAGQERAAARAVGEVFVTGGGELYARAMPIADRLYITHVRLAPPGDARFPPIDPTLWQVVSREPMARAQGDEAEAEFVTYERRPGA